MPSGLLHDETVVFYHPFDDFNEYTKGLAWSDFDVNSHFVSGILTSGIQRTDTGTPSRIIYPGGTYDSLGSASGFTAALWVNNLLANDGKSKIVYVGDTGEAGSPGTQNTVGLYKLPSADSLQILVTVDSVFSSKVWTPSPPASPGWHFFVVDARYETSGWRHRVSLDGSGWVDLGVNSNTNTPDAADSKTIVRLAEDTPITTTIDEVVLWGDNDLFTPEELSNLYELYNTHNTTMDKYTSTFGTIVSGDIHCFANGHSQTSSGISLYIPGQKETNSFDLYISVFNPTVNDTNLYIVGDQQVFDNLDQYIYGHILSSGSIGLYTTGIPVVSGSSNLYTQGPLLSVDNIYNFVHGHEESSGNISLFTAGLFPEFYAFVSVAKNNPSQNLNLFMYGIPSGSPVISFTNDSMALFINDSGVDTNVNHNWSSFVKISDAIVTPESGTWKSFVKVGNTSKDDVDLYTYGHAPGSPPHGTLIDNYMTLSVNGHSTDGGQEGLLSDGYYVANGEYISFTKVHFGKVEFMNFYISGAEVVAPTILSANLFTFGILDTTKDSISSHIFGQDVSNNSSDLFIFGIRDTKSNLATLYIEVTNVGLFNSPNTLYTHGF